MQSRALLPLPRRLAVALLHHPVVDADGTVVTASLTNLDLHDLSRITRTYGLVRCYLVSPLEPQLVLARTLLDHWLTGFGRTRNPDRAEALATVTICPDLRTAADDFRARCGLEVLLVATTAKAHPGAVSCRTLRRELEAEAQAALLLFGTWDGLAPQVLAAADRVLEPITGNTPYNHLSVRSAVAIVVDRLTGSA
ncbi:MAG: hypothetical protein A2284_01040 [Deltaproteobacteria bacterium RIFOXYA12_FULL_61_11]|nr:MAG: hypothetical protein A2284_01040 [Deltaproteobacteria bacterium RIFOXYA12_FULL_61_11]